jgi:RNA polymerase sigma factor (sigma-70 family)
MAESTPRELVDLLRASDGGEADRAWERFLERHSGTILDATWCVSQDYDGRMDRYAYVLEQLRTDRFKRLRRYTANPRARFQTWLTVVCRRLCVDYHRRRYGRDRAVGRESQEQAARRRRLVDLVAEELDPNRIRDASLANPEEQTRRTELSFALDDALSKLPPEDRLLLRLRFQDGLSVRATARVLRIPTVFHVYRQLNTTLGLLRSHLEAKGIDGADP